MKHIKTTSNEETMAKKAFANANPSGAIVADEQTKKDVKELLKTLKEIDELKLKASTLTGKIMSFMGLHEELVGDGKLIATWGPGSSSSKVDYDTIMAMYKVSQEDIDKNTVVTVTARKFSLEG